MKKSIGIGLGKVAFATKQEGVFEKRNNPYWENLIKDIKKSKGKIYFMGKSNNFCGYTSCQSDYLLVYLDEYFQL